MKTLLSPLLLLLVAGAPAWGMPHYRDERVVAQRVAELSRQGVREFAVYQVRQVGDDALPERNDPIEPRVTTYFFWRTAGHTYGQKFTATAAYVPVELKGSTMFAFPRLDQLPATRAEQANIKFVPPVMGPRPGEPLVVLLQNGRKGYFEVSPGTYSAEAARQRPRRQWAELVRRELVRAEPLFVQARPYTRPGW